MPALKPWNIGDLYIDQSVHLPLQNWVTSVSHLPEPRLATMMISMVAPSKHHLFPNAVAVSVTRIQSPVLPTPSLDLESGRQLIQCFALQKAAAARVSGGDQFLNN